MSKKGSGRGHGHRQLALEQLERRELLAGQVTVTKSGDELKVTGDNSSNQVAIVWVADDTFAVIGLGTDLKGTNPTAAGYEYKVISGIRNISANLKKGDDLLAVGNNVSQLVAFGEGAGVISSGSASAVASALESFLGSAADGIFQLDKQLKIRMEDGSDFVGIIDSNIGKRIDTDLGNGDNRILIDPTFIGDDLILRGGSGIDYVEIYNTEIAQMLDVNLGDGTNTMFVDGCDIGESAAINTGKGIDRIEFYDVDIDLNFIVRTNGGNDIVLYTGYDNGTSDNRAIIGRTADIKTGSGNDEVEICDADIGIKNGGEEIGWSLKINTEDGIDRVSVGCEGSIEEGEIDSAQLLNASVNVGDDLIINLGSGNDGDNSSGPSGGAVVRFVEIIDNFELHQGSGNDFFLGETIGVGHDAFLNGNDGHDSVKLSDFFITNNLSVNLGKGDDVGSVAAGLVQGNLEVDLEVDLDDGVDRFNLEDLTIGGTLDFDAGAKDDEVRIAEVSANKIFINMGSGNDRLDLENVSSNNEFNADGGSGNEDQLGDDSGDDVNDFNFEIFII